MIEKEVNQSFSSNENSADDLTQYLTFAVGNEEFPRCPNCSKDAA